MTTQIYLAERGRYTVDRDGQPQLMLMQQYGPLTGAGNRRFVDHGCPLRVDGALLSDAHLEFWGEIYTTNNLHARGVLFETFVTAPQATLEALARRAQAQYDDTPEPLLPAQARVQRRLDLQTPVGELERLEAELDHTPGAVRRNGTWIERLRHRAWPRHADRRIC